MGKTTIEWADFVFNPWEGCTKVSPGCAHCYAEARNQRFAGGANWGKGAPRRRTSEAYWKQPLKWDEACGRRGAIGRLLGEGQSFAEEPRRPRVFCASIADWLDDEVPIEWLADLLELIRLTPNLNWLLLSKRPQNWETRIRAAGNFDHSTVPNADTAVWLDEWINGRPPANVWIGTSVEDQTRADERIPQLLQIPARVRFLSCEPLLGLVNLYHHFFHESGGEKWPAGTLPTDAVMFGWQDGVPLYRRGIHWVIAGGESGPGARPMHPAWARSLRDQCAGAGVAFHFKQWGEWSWEHPMSTMEKACGETMFKPGHFRRLDETHAQIKVGKKAAGRLLDGVEHNAFPLEKTS